MFSDYNHELLRVAEQSHESLLVFGAFSIAGHFYQGIEGISFVEWVLKPELLESGLHSCFIKELHSLKNVIQLKFSCFEKFHHVIEGLARNHAQMLVFRQGGTKDSTLSNGPLNITDILWRRISTNVPSAPMNKCLMS